MITKYATEPNKNGNIFQMIIDDKEQTIKTGYFLFGGSPDYRVKKSIIRKVEAATDTPEKKREFFKIFALIGG